MDKSKLIKKIKDNEWEQFEVKEAKDKVPKNIWKTVSSFSNTAGGWIILGFYIPLSNNKPVYYNSRKNTFIRTGSGDQRASDEEIDAMYRDASFGTKDKESTNLSYEDLDKETISSFRTYLKNVDPDHSYNNLSNKVLMQKLRVLINGKVTVGGLLVFGNDDSIGKVFSDFKVDYLEIIGTSNINAKRRYEFRLIEQKNLYEYFFSIFERLIKKIEIPFKLKGAFRDENQPQVKAIREALVNLLIHSDYFSPMKPRIRVFSDRIEFLNPGALPKPFEQIRKEDISLPRNPIITKIFRVIKLSENAGYGFNKMFNGWKHHYKTEPEVSGVLDYYKIVFKLGKDVGKDVGKTKRQKIILEKIKNQVQFTYKSLSKEFKVSEKTIERDIAELKEQKKIKYVGSKRKGYWIIGE
ncbi:DeoR family transcriptional regulator [Candidatus Woesearchaeota archaeon]|nr:DeoR family transcriptional regulator [Candidatus Woesearchaeota archaeon]